jgi:hypothetical protein
MPPSASTKIEIPTEQLAGFCRRWQISEFALFGSVLSENFRSDSDIDVLVTFAPEARWSLLSLVQMNTELEKIFGRKVDLVSRRGLETSRNYLRRKAILNSAQVIDVA